MMKLINKLISTAFIAGFLVFSLNRIDTGRTKISLEKIYLDIYEHRELLKHLKNEYKASRFNYKLYDGYEYRRDLLRARYGKCEPILAWIDKGEVLVDALIGRSDLTNDKIYEIFYDKPLTLAKECK